MTARTPMFLGGAIALGIFLAAVPHFAGTQVLAFDAATVKPNNSGSGNSSTESTNGLLRITNQTLLRMMQYAYNVRDFQISGGPAWVRSDRYDVTAKPDGSVRDQQMKEMLPGALGRAVSTSIPSTNPRRSDLRPAYRKEWDEAAGRDRVGL